MQMSRCSSGSRPVARGRRFRDGRVDVGLPAHHELDLLDLGCCISHRLVRQVADRADQVQVGAALFLESSVVLHLCRQPHINHSMNQLKYKHTDILCSEMVCCLVLRLKLEMYKV